MSYRFHVLGSSSSGNCGFLETSAGKFLIDAGFSGKRIGEMLAAIGERVEDLNGVFLTHEHGDHACGLRGLCRGRDLKVYATEGTARGVQAKLKSDVNWQLFEAGKSFAVNDLMVKTVSIPHDAYDPVGFCFDWGEPDLFNACTRLAWVTDLGHMTAAVWRAIESAHVVVLEANYSDALLDGDTKRPWHVKERSRSRHGHLSNADVAKLLINATQVHWQEVYLGHLSRDCNTLASLRADLTGVVQDCRFAVRVIDPHSGEIVSLLLPAQA